VLGRSKALSTTQLHERGRVMSRNAEGRSGRLPCPALACIAEDTHAPQGMDFNTMPLGKKPAV
jgi:hypothetical protein